MFIIWIIIDKRKNIYKYNFMLEPSTPLDIIVYDLIGYVGICS